MNKKNMVFVIGIFLISFIFYFFNQYIESDSKQNKFIFLDKINQCSKMQTCKEKIVQNEIDLFHQVVQKDYKPLTKQDTTNINLLITNNMQKINTIFSNIDKVLKTSNYPVILLYLSRYYQDQNITKVLYSKYKINLYKKAANNIAFLFLQNQLDEFIKEGKKLDSSDIDLDALNAYYYLIMARDTKSIIDKVKYVNQSVSLIETSFQEGEDFYYNRLYRLIIHSKLPSTFSNKEYIAEDIDLFKSKFESNGYLKIYPNQKKVINKDDLNLIDRVTNEN